MKQSTSWYLLQDYELFCITRIVKFFYDYIDDELTLGITVIEYVYANYRNIVSMTQMPLKRREMF